MPHTFRLIPLTVFVTLFFQLWLNSLVSAVSFAQDQQAFISGRITDFNRRPLEGIEVKLFDSQNGWSKVVTSQGNGAFSIGHKQCKLCQLEVLPGPRSGLATALIRQVPGDQDRNYVVALQRGFLVQGKVSSGGKGLKGVQITVVDNTQVDQGNHVYEGGTTTTGRNGTFQITLTPGRKKLLVDNNRYAELTKHSEQEITVTSDMQLDEIVLTQASR